MRGLWLSFIWRLNVKSKNLFIILKNGKLLCKPKGYECVVLKFETITAARLYIKENYAWQASDFQILPESYYESYLKEKENV